MKLKDLNPGETFRTEYNKNEWQYLGAKAFKSEIYYLYRQKFSIKGYFTDNGDLDVTPINS